MKIAIISDTHGLLRDETIEIIKKSYAVIHAGDFDRKEIFDKIKELNKPLFAVRGNNDREWAEELPITLDFELCGIRFLLVHNKKDIPENMNADIIIFGHSHKYCEEYADGKLYLNPGSCGKRRFNLTLTMAELNIGENGYSIKKVEIKE